MLRKQILIASLMATSILAAGMAHAADQSSSPPSQQQVALDKDVGRLSKDGAQAYGDIASTRLAIFDGRIDDAKKFIHEADADFAKSKTDETVFTKAEADFKTPDTKGANVQPGAASQAPNAPKSVDASTPKAWLPVDGEMIVNEDFSTNPKKAAAVAEANKTLAAGDKKGAMEKLKLADVDIDFVMAVVPLDQTIADVHQASAMLTDGKYYEASQMLRQVQDGTRYDLLDINATPKLATSSSNDKAPATH